MFGQNGSSALARSRWAGIGAAVAVSLGAGGIGLIAHAASNATPSSFVSITPCRLFDTRPGGTIGDRSTPLNADETFVRQVAGANGNCTIPATATAISYNLTIPNGLDGYLTLYPADAARPGASTINPVTGQGVKVNGGIVGLSATGAIALYSLRGPLDALLDITGYFVPAVGGSSVGGSASTPGVNGAPGADGIDGLDGIDGADGVDGIDGADGRSAWDEIPSGHTVMGSIVYDTHSSATTDTDAVSIDLPGVAPLPLTDGDVNLSADSGSDDFDLDCSGNPEAPSAPAGKVCIYLSYSSGVDLMGVTGVAGLLSTQSFAMTFVSTGDPDADEAIYATWAYTAP